MPDAKTEAEVAALIEKLCACLEDQHHNVALSALLSLYRAVAVQHPCCTQSAANTAMTAAMQLAMAARGATPRGASVH